MSDIIDNIIKSNKDINMPDNDGNLLLHILVKYNKKEEIESLLPHKPIIVFKNKEGETPLCIAKRLNYKEIQDLIVKYCDDNEIDCKNISSSSSENSLYCSNSNDSEYSEYSSLSSSTCSTSSDNLF